jgi:hypothetical protein
METLLKDLDFTGLYKVFDLIFILAAVASCGLIFISNKFKRMKYERYLEYEEFDHKKK